MDQKTLAKALLLMGLLIIILAVISYVVLWVSLYVHVGSLNFGEEVAFDITEAFINLGFNTGPILLVGGVILFLLPER
jgi:hypothetical protein